MADERPDYNGTPSKPAGSLEETATGAAAPGIGQDDKNSYDYELESTLYARHIEVQNLENLVGKENQRGTPIPALFHQFYKFIQNPSTVSVETYKRMVDTDDTIGSGCDFLTTCLAARLGRYQHKSEEITEWVNNQLENIEGGFLNVVKEIASATWTGYSVSEKVWANEDQGFVPKKVVTLPPSTILFETDRTGELTADGILQYQRNYNPVALSQGIGFFGGVTTSFGFDASMVRPDVFAKLGDAPFPIRTANTYNYLSIRIPKLKCIHYAFDAQGKFGNPYGRSLLRRAYKYYVMKDAFLKMLATALDRKGTPLTIVYADPNTTIRDPNNVTRGEHKSTSRGKTGQGISAQQGARDAFEKIHNDTTIILPGKKGQIYDTDFVPQASNTADFIQALDFCNMSILRSLLIPSLIFGNGDGTGSYSLGQEHARTFDKILDGHLAGLKQVLLQQLVKEMIAYNFPTSAWKDDGLGDFSKRDLTDEERNKIMDMYNQGINAGVIDTEDLNDLNQMRDTMGFEPRDEVIPRPDEYLPDDLTYRVTENGDQQGGGDEIELPPEVDNLPASDKASLKKYLKFFRRRA